MWFFLPNHVKFEQVFFLGVSAYAFPLPRAPTTPQPEKGKDLGEKLEVCSMPSKCISYRVLHAKMSSINCSYVYDLEYLHENTLSRPKKGRTVSANQLRCRKVEVKIAKVKFSLSRHCTFRLNIFSINIYQCDVANNTSHHTRQLLHQQQNHSRKGFRSHIGTIILARFL